MQLSWSHTLFLVLNRWIGVSRWYDGVVRFLARVVLFVLAAFVGGLVIITPAFAGSWLSLLSRLCVAWCLGMGVSWLIAWRWAHPRPILELPGIKTLMKPLSNWKSFPSDHAFSAWLLVFFWGLVAGSGWWLWILVLLAIGVSAGRVLAGVHYPRDIVAGMALAGVVAWAFFG